MYDEHAYHGSLPLGDPLPAVAQRREGVAQGETPVVRVLVVHGP